MASKSDQFPHDADGDVLRNLQRKGFDFSRSYTIDFVVDFDTWPPDLEVLNAIRAEFPNAYEYVDDQSGEGSVIVKIQEKLTYALVIGMQEKLTNLASPFGGWCEAWGVLH